jgi:hypothetical protein
MSEREGRDPLLEVGIDLVGLPWPPSLPQPPRLETEALELALPAVVARAVHPHHPAGLRDVAELLGQREHPQAESEQHVILRHAAPPLLDLVVDEGA